MFDALRYILFYMTNNYILVIAAVAPEITAVLDRLEDMSIQRTGGRSVWTGKIGNNAVKVVVTNPGIVNTVQAMTACIEDRKPQFMIQTGCAGGFKELGLRVGDIAVATKEIDAQLGIDTGKDGAILQKIPFPVLTTGGMAFREEYELDSNIAETVYVCLKKSFFQKEIGIYKGSFITVSTITGSKKRADSLFKAFSPCMESMEGSAGAFLSHYYRIPFTEIRCVSNLVGKRDLSGWNLPLACKRAGEAAVAILSSI